MIQFDMQLQEMVWPGEAFKPYKAYPESGDCADTDLKNVSKTSYGHEFAFRLAGVLQVKHAPD